MIRIYIKIDWNKIIEDIDNKVEINWKLKVSLKKLLETDENTNLNMPISTVSTSNLTCKINNNGAVTLNDTAPKTTYISLTDKL